MEQTIADQLNTVDLKVFIEQRLEVKKIGPPPILCWIGSQRHRLTENVGRALLLEVFAYNNSKVGAEIGVDRGVYSEQMLNAIPGLKLYGVDSWATERSLEHYEDTQRRLSNKNVTLMKMSSMEAVEKFKDEELDFVYIDSQRDFNSVITDIIEWSKKVKRGGVVAGRGYCRLFDTGVVEAVDAYTYAHNIRRWYITRELEPNWFFVK